MLWKIKGNVGQAREEEIGKLSNIHSSVKPIDLLEYLTKLTSTPTGGTVLDPFMGSGSQGIACVKQGRDFIGIERDEEYFRIAEARIAHEQKKGRQTTLF